MDENLLVNYITGQASDGDKETIKKWIDESEERKLELVRLKNVWNIAGLSNEVNQEKKQKAIQQILQKIKRLKTSSPKSIGSYPWFKYAAILILFLCLSGTMGYVAFRAGMYNQLAGFTEIIVPNGERSDVILPDGSHVKLNSGSSLKFNLSVGGSERKVQLNGEAFFDVVHDKTRPFIVETSGMDVEVLGTKFNITSYSDDQLITTFLESGKVKVNVKGKKPIFLKPNEVVRLEKNTNKLSKLVANDGRYTDWRKGILTMKDETMAGMARKLERRFGVEIQFGDPGIKKHTYNGSLKGDDLITVLEAMKFSSSMTYKRLGNRVILYSAK